MSLFIKKYLSPVLYSFLACFSSLVIALFFHHLFTLLGILSLDYEPKIMNDWIVGLPLKTEYWSSRRVLVINSTGSIGCLILSLFILNFSKKFTPRFSQLRIFFLWLSISCLSILNANIILGIVNYGNFHSPFYKGFSVIYAWLYLPRIIVACFIVLSIIFQFLVSRIYLHEFLLFVGNKDKVTSAYSRSVTLIRIGFIPLLASSLLYLPLSSFPTEIYFNSIRCSLMFITMLSLFIILVNKMNVRFKETMKVTNGSVIPILIIFSISLFSLLLWRFF